MCGTAPLGAGPRDCGDPLCTAQWVRTLVYAEAIEGAFSCLRSFGCNRSSRSLAGATRVQRDTEGVAMPQNLVAGPLAREREGAMSASPHSAFEIAWAAQGGAGEAAFSARETQLLNAKLAMEDAVH